MIVLDTSALSQVFRRPAGAGAVHPVVGLFRALVDADEDLRVPGLVLQELLSGVRTERDFVRLDEALSGFPLMLADAGTHRRAAKVRNACRAGGVAAAAFDSLLAAHCLEHDAALLTLDHDFLPMQPLVGLRLMPISE